MAAGEPIVVAISSPQAVVRAGLVTLLSSHPERFRVVPLPNGPDDEEPDVVIYDVVTLVDNDTKQLRLLVEQSFANVLAMSRDLRPDLVSQALEAGADGFFAIGVDAEELVAAVESAGTGWEEGDPGENPTVGSSESEARAAQLGADAGLSEREAGVLAGIARGDSNQAIADELYLTINSVKTYVRSAYRKIGARSRSQAVSWAIQHGFDPGPPTLDLGDTP